MARKNNEGNDYKKIRANSYKQIWLKDINSLEMKPHQATLKQFKVYCETQSGIKRGSIANYSSAVRHFINFSKVKDLKKVTKKDIDTYFLSSEVKGRMKGFAKLGPYTQQTRRILLAFFFKWLELDEKLIDYVKPKHCVNSKLKLPEELITGKEINKLIQVADNMRDKALVSTLDESACRKGELLGCKLKHVTFDKYGAVLMVDGKTGQRRIRLLNSAALLQQWVESHPNRNDPNAPLFVSKDYRNQPLGNEGLKFILNKLQKKAGIKKHIHAHLFRHSRLTELAKILTEQELKVFAGWAAGSNMASIYCHLSGKDVDNKLLQAAGKLEVEEEQKLESKRKPQRCNRCNMVNDATAMFCSKCGLPLSIDTAMRLGEQQKKRDVDVKKVLKILVENMDEETQQEVVSALA